MKNILLLLLILLINPQRLFPANAQVDSVQIRINSLTKEVGSIKAAMVVVKDSIMSFSKKMNKCSCVPDGKGSIEGGEWGLVFLPAGIFILAVIIFSFALKNFDFKEALQENDLPKIIIKHPLLTGQAAPAGVTEPQTIEITDPNSTHRPSISRYIAFISSLLIIILAVCISCFFTYHYVKTGCPPELGALSTVIIALGIGIIPYGVNKISTALSGPKKEF